MEIIFSIITMLFSFFVVDTIAQGFNPEIPGRYIPMELKVYSNKNFAFFVHIILGWVLPFIILLFAFKWYFAVVIFFIALQLVHVVSKFIFDERPDIFERVIQNPILFTGISMLLYVLSTIYIFS